MIDFQTNITFFKKTLDEEVKFCNRIARIHTDALKSVDLWKEKVKELNERETKRLEKEGRVAKKEVKKIEKEKEVLAIEEKDTG